MKIRLFLMLSSIFMLSLSLKTQAAVPLFVEVITSDAYKIVGVEKLRRRGVSVAVYNLDDGKRLVSGMAVNLPNQQNLAKKTLEQRFKKMGATAVNQQFSQAFKATTISTQYGLTRYPAVVFNHGQSVVYGVTDIIRAVFIYQQSDTQ